jgi:hypothetical protein
MADFCLVSTELRSPYAPHVCTIIRRLRSETRNDLAFVRIDPPLDKEVYDTDDDVHYLILASRLKDTSLFPITEFPIAVYICLLKCRLEEMENYVSNENLTIIDWSEIRPI